jgi:hypothetical protein
MSFCHVSNSSPTYSLGHKSQYACLYRCQQTICPIFISNYNLTQVKHGRWQKIHSFPSLRDCIKFGLVHTPLPLRWDLPTSVIIHMPNNCFRQVQANGTSYQSFIMTFGVVTHFRQPHFQHEFRIEKDIV